MAPAPLARAVLANGGERRDPLEGKAYGMVGEVVVQRV